MRKQNHCLLKTVTILALLIAANAFSQEVSEYGPPKGTLVIVGGNMRDPAIASRFIELAGGPDANFVIVPTAGANRSADGTVRIYKEEGVIAPWKKRGLKNVTRLYQPWEKPYYVLSPGDVHNMKTRKIEKLGNGTRRQE